MKRCTLLLLCLLVSLGINKAYAQKGEVQVSGVVIASDDNSPIVGATVRGKVSKKGVATNAMGQFSFTVPESEKILVVSFIGMHTQEVAVGKNLRVVLEYESEALDEVLVVAYGTTKKSSFTGSAVSVNSSELTASRSESVDKALNGKLSGVRVSNRTGDPGSAGQIQIRGIGSITGSTQPLYVIDGIPVTTGKYGMESDGGANMSTDILSTLNPEDVESLTVLKDAAAASLYGSRAANGVVVITTKKGASGKHVLNFSANLGWNELATNSYMPMNSAEYAEYFRNGLISDYLYGEEAEALLPNQKNFKDQSKYLKAAEAFAQQHYLDPEFTPITTTTDAQDWRKYVYPGGLQQDYQVSLSGGNDQVRYFGSLGHSNMDGLVRYSNFKRYSTLVNLDVKPQKWLDLHFKNQMSYTLQVGKGDKSNQSGSIPFGAPLSIYLMSNPSQGIYNEDGSYNLNASNSSNIKNAAMALDEKMVKMNTEAYKVGNDLGAIIKLYDWLRFTSNNSVDWFTTKSNNYWNPESLDGQSLNGLGERYNYNVLTLTTSNFFSVSQSFNNLHNLDVTLGHEYQYYKEGFEMLAASDYSNTELIELSNGQPKTASTSVLSSALLSFFGNVSYNYDNKYYLGASLRGDESSRLGKDKRWGLFWSASASWRFAHEAFLDDNNVLTDGKLRFSYGTNGNLPGAAYGHLGLYAMTGNYNNSSAIYKYQLANNNLGWEQSQNMNIGIDLTFFNRNWSLDFRV